MDTWYSKGNPKIHNHNPILHSPFYTQTERFSSHYHSSMYKTAFSSPPPFSQVRSSLARTAARQFEAPPTMTTARLYKTRPKSIFSDPITGTIRKYQTMPVSSLDGMINKPPVTQSPIYNTAY